MNWFLFAIFAYVMLALEVGLAGLLGFQGASGAVTPSFVLILAVYIGMLAPTSVVPWAMLILGLLVDLQPGPVQDAVVVGPMALGYLTGAFAVLQLRALVFRESVISLAAMIFGVGVFVHLVAVALLTMRGLPWTLAEPIAGWNAADQLVHRFLHLLYTAGMALPIGAILFKITPLWHFTSRQRGK